MRMPRPLPSLSPEPACASSRPAPAPPSPSAAPPRRREGDPPPAPPAPSSPAVTVTEVAFAATVQDLGRPGHAAEGISASGAADRAALRTANRLLGNAEDAAGIEITMGGLRGARRARSLVRGHRRVGSAAGRRTARSIRMPSSAGPPGPSCTSTGSRTAHADISRCGAGSPRARRSDRSRTDTLAGLGPAPLRAGDVFALAGRAEAPAPPKTSTRGALPATN